MPDFNLAPPILPLSRLLYPVLLILVAVIGVFVVLPVYQEKEAFDSALQRVRGELALLDRREKAASTKKGEAQELQDATKTLKEQSQALGVSRREADALLAAMVGVFQARPAKVKLTSVGWRQGELVVEGEAADYEALVQYRSQIQAVPVVAGIASFTSRESKTSFLFSLAVQVRSKE